MAISRYATTDGAVLISDMDAGFLWLEEAPACRLVMDMVGPFGWGYGSEVRTDFIAKTCPIELHCLWIPGDGEMYDTLVPFGIAKVFVDKFVPNDDFNRYVFGMSGLGNVPKTEIAMRFHAETLEWVMQPWSAIVHSDPTDEAWADMMANVLRLVIAWDERLK